MVELQWICFHWTIYSSQPCGAALKTVAQGTQRSACKQEENRTYIDPQEPKNGNLLFCNKVIWDAIINKPLERVGIEIIIRDNEGRVLATKKMQRTAFLILYPDLAKTFGALQVVGVIICNTIC